MPRAQVRPQTLRLVKHPLLTMLALLFLCLGCGSEAKRVGAPRASLVDQSSATLGYVTPGRWRYHPPRSAPLTASFELNPTQRLFVGYRGERWLYDKSSETVTAAAALAPERLLAVLHQENGAFVFVGDSGTAYEASEPLGDFERALGPLEPLAKVTASRRTIVGVRRDGRLAVSDNHGATWQEVGPARARFSDVLLNPDGRGIALEIPERTWSTHDHGQTWQPLSLAPLGVLGFARGASGILLYSALGLFTLTDDASPPRPTTSSQGALEIKLPVLPPRGPSAQALKLGRAIVLDQDYFEVSARPSATPGGAHAVTTATPGTTTATPGASRDWQLLHGDVDSSLRRRDFAIAKGCADVKLAGHERWVYVACARAEDSKALNRGTVDVALFESEDRGASFRRVAYTLRAHWPRLRLAVGEAKNLLLSGVCAQNNELGCQPLGIHYLSSGVTGSAPKLVPSVTPSFAGLAEAMTFSYDGRTAYAVGRRTKSDVASVFVSKDFGRHFSAREVDGLTIGREQDEGFGISSIAAASDGTLSLTFRAAGSDAHVLLLDEDGRTLALSELPTRAAVAGAFGSRVLAVEKKGSDVWESLNGGSSWERVGSLPVVLCEPGVNDKNECNFDVYCHATGCVLGDSLSRQGWRGQLEQGNNLLPPPEVTQGSPQQAVRTPIACSFAAPDWRPLRGVRRIPSVEQAAIGDAAWFAVGHSPADASAAVYSMRRGKHEQVERVELLAPVKDARNFAYYPSLQVEGGAALRYRLPTATNPRLSNVEIAWQDLVHGLTAKTRLADGGSYRASDAERNGDWAQTARPALVSIAEGGLYVELHHESVTNQPTYFVSPTQTSQIPPLSWPAVVPKGRDEMIRVGNADLPLRFLGAVAVARANWDGKEWKFAAQTSGWIESARFGFEQSLDLTYLNGRPVLHVSWVDPARARGEGYILPFRADGALFAERISAPTQGSLEMTPLRCSQTERDATARVIATRQPGTRHPVLITDAAEPIRVMLSAEAVLYGTSENPCAAAFGAESIESGLSLGTDNEHALVMIDDMEHSWLFRLVLSGDGKPEGVEYRMLSCHFDQKLEVPLEVFSAPGTMVGQ